MFVPMINLVHLIVLFGSHSVDQVIDFQSLSFLLYDTLQALKIILGGKATEYYVSNLTST